MTEDKEKKEKILMLFSLAPKDGQQFLDEKHNLKELFTRDDIIKGTLEREEKMLLFKIIEIMEEEPVTDIRFKYDWVLNMSSEECWLKRETNERFFEVLKGNVSAIEYDIFWNNYDILNHFTTFQKLEHLMLHIYGAFPEIDNLQLDSVTSLSINFVGEYDYPIQKIIKLFPNASLISISNGKNIKDWNSLTAIENLEHVILLRTFMSEETKKQLNEAGIKIT